MNEKIRNFVNSKTGTFVVSTAGSAAINIAVGLVIGMAIKGAAKLVEVAADAVSKNSQEVA